ncbi:MAG: winged helix-turn-helix transcriptional regulator [Actinobacteria bacterium]|nr:winged helix-turn-helix transcriptional regulator [Actinomycetota bacterium]
MKFPGVGAERVARAILAAGPATAVELAERLGSSPTVVRRHLDSLVDEELVVAGERRPYGPNPARGRGRPARVFALTDKGRNVFDAAYDDVAVGALRYLRVHGGDTAVRGFAQQRAAEMVSRYAPAVVSQHGPVTRLAALAGVLTADGYAATAGEAEAGPQLCQHHCPVSHVAAEFPEICEAETQAFEDLLGTHVLRLATIGRGDGICTTLVPSLMNRRTPA